MKNRRNLFYWLSAIAVLAFGVIWFRENAAQWDQLKAAFARFAPSALVLGFLAISFQVLSQCFRIWSLLPGRTAADIPRAIRALFYGQFLNAFIPARAGDAMKVYQLRHETLTVQGGIGVILADKLIDTVSFLLLCLVSLPFWLKSLPVEKLLPTHRANLWWIAGGIALLLSPLTLAPVRQRALNFLRGISAGLSGLARPAIVGSSLLFAMGSWAGELCCLGLLAQTQGHPLSPTELIWILAVLNVGIAVPVAVANVGAFEGSMVFAMKMVGIDTGAGLAIAMTHHIIQIVVITTWTALTWGVFEGRKRMRNKMKSEL